MRSVWDFPVIKRSWAERTRDYIVQKEKERLVWINIAMMVALRVAGLFVGLFIGIGFAALWIKWTSHGGAVLGFLSGMITICCWVVTWELTYFETRADWITFKRKGKTY